MLLMLAAASMAILSVAVAGGASPALYSSPLMCLLWALVGASALTVCLRRHIWRTPSLLLIHVSLLLILIGAAVTHFSGKQGSVALRVGGDEVRSFVVDESGENESLPFAISAKAYETLYYPSTSTPKDFQAKVKIASAEGSNEVFDLTINHLVEKYGYKFVLKSVDSDGEGFVLNLRHDPAGTLISFVAYGLLLLGFILYFLKRNSAFRQALSKLRKAEGALLPAILLLSLFSFSPTASAMKIPEQVVGSFASLQTLNNGRVSSIMTLANDFTSTLTGGRTSWQSHPAEEILTGYLFDFTAWKKAELIKVKSKELRNILGVKGSRASYAEYMKAVTEGRLNLSDANVTSKFAEDIGRFETITRLLTGELLKIFPVEQGGTTQWLTPASKLPPQMEEGEWILVKRSIALINQSILQRDWDEAQKLIGMIATYQIKRTGLEPASVKQLRLENLYFKYGNGFWIAIVSICLGLALMAVSFSPSIGRNRLLKIATFSLLLLAFLTLSGFIAMQWVISEHIPLSDGFETMQFMGWLMLGIALCGFRKDALWSGMAALGGGLALSVAAMNGGVSSLGPLMPVLSSPLLSIHVVCVMGAYALFLLMSISAVVALSPVRLELRQRLTLLNHTLLYPAIALLAGGIFIGAVWADMSWGIYWSWDPKEVWALITLLIYSLPAHPAILKKFRNHRFFNVYILLSFLSVLITFFGVNYFLGGLHSYA